MIAGGNCWYGGRSSWAGKKKGCNRNQWDNLGYQWDRRGYIYNVYIYNKYIYIYMYWIQPATQEGSWEKTPAINGGVVFRGLYVFFFTAEQIWDVYETEPKQLCIDNIYIYR